MKFPSWWWSTAIGVGTASFLILYLVIISGQGNRPAAWFVIALAVGGSLPTIGLVTPAIRMMCFVASAVALTTFAMLSGFSIGVFLVPAAVIGWTAVTVESLRPAPRRGDYGG